MRRNETSTLAFLDVMACGLGAVILILVVLKQQSPLDTPTETEQTVRATETESDLDKMQAKLDRMLATGKNVQNHIERQKKLTAVINATIKKTKQDLTVAAKRASSLDSSIKNSRSALEQPQTHPPPDPIDTLRTTQPQYIVGLMMTGNKIVILLDRSASMTARELVKIVKYKASPPAARRGAKKWINSLDAVWWMIARAPEQSRLQIASFSDITTFHTANWVEAGDSTALAGVKAKMTPLIPEGSTNLEAAVSAAIKTGADSIYIITDGLPTAAPGGQTLFGLDGCGSKWVKRKQVTGKCRISLFHRTVAAAAGNKVRISIVLMPLEGDPDAAPLFSKWALSKGGVLMSAARNWP